MAGDEDRRVSAQRVIDEATAVAVIGGEPRFRLKMLEMAAKMREMLARAKAEPERR